MAIGHARPVGAEEIHAAGLPDLAGRVENDGCHAAFVVLVGAVNVEKF